MAEATHPAADDAVLCDGQVLDHMVGTGEGGEVEERFDEVGIERKPAREYQRPSDF